MNYKNEKSIMKAQLFFILAFVCLGEVVHYSDVLKAFKPKSEGAVIAILSLPLTRRLKKKLRARLLEEESESASKLKARIDPGEQENLEVDLKDQEAYVGEDGEDLEIQTNNLDGASFFPASYARWLEEAGAMVVPLEFHLDSHSLMSVLRKSDGLLLTGGAAPLFSNDVRTHHDNLLSSAVLTRVPSRYSQKAAELLKFAEELNKTRRFPVWATCLGFEAMVLREGAFEFPFNSVHNLNVNSPIDFVDPSKLKSIGDPAKELLSRLNPKQLEMMRSKNMFYFNHENAFLVSEYTGMSSLSKNFDILASAKTKNKHVVSPFVAVIAHKRLPFFGVQFHPEKTKFEPSAQEGLEDKATANELSGTFAKFFVDLASHNTKGPSQRNLQDLNLNFEVSSVSKVGSFESLYVFTKSTNILI